MDFVPGRQQFPGDAALASDEGKSKITSFFSPCLHHKLLPPVFNQTFFLIFFLDACPIARRFPLIYDCLRDIPFLAGHP